LFGHAPLEPLSLGLGTDVAAHAGGVHRHVGAVRAAEELVRRLPGHFPEQVPDRGVDAAQGPVQEGAGELVVRTQCLGHEGLTVPGVLAEEERRDHLVQHLHGDAGAVRGGLPDALGAVVGADAHGCHLAQQQGFDRLDLHWLSPPFQVVPWITR
jgi:hypothetical protein